MSKPWTVTGSPERALKAVREGAAAGLDDASRGILERSNARVPVDQGDLLASGRVVVDPDTLKAAVSYGGTPELDVVAVVQHERMDYHHPSGGQPKFLESSFVDERNNVLPVIAAAIKKRT